MERNITSALRRALRNQKGKERPLSEAKKGPISPTRNESFFANLIDEVREAIICTDSLGRVLLFNRGAQALWKYREEQVIGKDIRILAIEEERDLCCPWVDPKKIESGLYEGEFLFQRADGSLFFGDLRASLIEVEEGDRYVAIVVRDITEKKELGKRLRESERLSCLRHMIKGFSHEIRNPIVALGGYARRIYQQLDTQNDLSQYLKAIIEDAERLERMLKDIEDYLYYLEKYRPKFKKVDIVETIEDVTFSFKKDLEAGKINIRRNFPDAHPMVFADRSHLKELFYHLIQNALDAMPEGGRLELSVSRNGNEVYALVSDTGVGIDPSNLENIYEPFYTSKLQSVGVGLAKAYIIVEEHGGSIEVESEVNKGTTFKVTFPTDRRKRARR